MKFLLLMIRKPRLIYSGRLKRMGDAAFEMSREERAELITEFLAEGREHLGVLNEKLLKSEESVKNNTEMSDDDLDAMFRAAHTIKGTASFIGLSKVVKLTHEMETLLQRVKTREMKLTVKIIDVLFATFDVLESLFSGLKEHGEEKADIEKSVSKIKAILGSGAEEENVKAEQIQEAETISKDNTVDVKYLKQYIEEMQQTFEVFNEHMTAVEKGDVQDNREVINDLFRIMHTIKGSSGIVNADAIVAVAHSMENIFSVFRKRGQMPDSAIIPLLFKGIDTIEVIVSELKEKQAITTDVSALVSELETYHAQLVSGRKVDNAAADTQDPDALMNTEQLSDGQKKILSQAITEGQDIFKILFIIDKVIPFKSMKVLLVEKKLKKVGVVVATQPVPEEIDKMDGQNATVGIIFCSGAKEKEIRTLLSLDGVTVLSIKTLDQSTCAQMLQPDKQTGIKIKKQETQAASRTTQKSPTSSPKTVPIDITTIRIDSQKLDNLLNLSGELVILRAQFARLVDLFESDIEQQRNIFNLVVRTKLNVENLIEDTGNYLRKIKGPGQETVKIQKMMDELSTNILSLERNVDKYNFVNRIHSLDETTHSLGKISSDIQFGVMQTRMIPVEGVFTRFKRIVRNIAKDLRKDINLTIIGEETELDKTIVDSLGDPLTHMIRNAVDHGIEDTATRRSMNKPETGNIFLKASHRGNNICIEVRDDGKGLDPEELAKHALAQNLIAEEQVSAMNEKEKFDLMFLPGFSTAEKVTGLSGRGVGMDVVKSMINSVNGVIEVDTEIGEGTTFILKIPLTLAIIQALLVVIGDETYAIPIEGVTEIVKIPEKEIYSIDGNPTVTIRGHALSLVTLDTVIKLKGGNQKREKDKQMIIITDGENQLGIIVDALIGEDEIVIKSLSEHFANIRGVSGASILADGRVALILDPAAIIKKSK